MPILLKKETRQRLEASQKSLLEALRIAQQPKFADNGAPDLSSGSIEIGLIGTAAELAINACLYEILGKKGILRSRDSYYLTASEALSKFKELLNSRIPKTSQLYKGTSKGVAHLDDLKSVVSKFSILFTARACGFHGGEGVTNQVVLHSADSVAAFLKVLARGSKWAPYLTKIATATAPLKEKSLLIDELSKLVSKNDTETASKALASIFLVLPEIPEEEPDWIQALERIQIAPKAHDLTLLISTLKSANIGGFSKVGNGIEALAIKITDKDDPNALEVYPSHIKKNFTNPYEMWRAVIGTTNTNLNNNIFSPPHISQIYHFFAIGPTQIGIPKEELKGGLGAHDIWPFIASSLSYQGTTGPCFFLSRHLKENEKGQLNALLNKASKLNKRLSKNMSNYRQLIEATCEGKAIKKKSKTLDDLNQSCSKREECSHNISSRLEMIVSQISGSEKEASEEISNMYENTGRISLSLELLIKSKDKVSTSFNKLARPLCCAAHDFEDLPVLAALLAYPELEGVHTEARKAIRDIDYAHYGPKVSNA